MKVRVDQSILSLTNKNFIGSGGQADVYDGGSHGVVKIYHDAKDMIPEGKIQELAALDHAAVIRPEKIAYKPKGTKPVGYTMHNVSNCHTLCELFPKSFWDRNHLNANKALDLVRNMQSTLQKIHESSVLVVDLNELNVLVAKDFKQVYWIDVDSYQTEHYPATAIMASIRDPLVEKNKFTEDSDWFSFAIITFQLLVGIHPYKGKHKHCRGLNARMINKLSIFSSDVRIPKTCRPFDSIPQVYRNWYHSVLEKGNRSEPPFDMSEAITVQWKSIVSTDSDLFEITVIGDYGDEILEYAQYGDQTGAITIGDVFVGQSKLGMLGAVDHPLIAHDLKGDLLIVGLSGAPTVYVEYMLRRTKANHTPPAEQVMVYEGRIYIKYGEFIQELQHGILDTFTGVTVATCMPKATRLYPGVAIQNMLGAYYASIFPAAGEHRQIKLDELKGYKIIDAKLDRRVLMVVGIKDGQYDRFVYRFNENFQHDLRKVEDVTYTGLNFVSLDSGVCICINENEEVEMFGPYGSSTVRTVEDSSIHGRMRLYRHGGNVLATEGSKLYRIKMKREAQGK